MKKTIILSISTALLLFASTEIRKNSDVEKINEQLALATKIDLEDILILNQKKIILPSSNKKLTLFKVEDKRSHKGQIVVFDENNEQVNYKKLREKEKEFRFNKMGVMNESLFKKVSNGGDIPVMLQLAIKEKFIDKNQFEGRGIEFESIALKEQERVANKAKEIFATIKKEYHLKSSQEATFSGPFLSVTLSSDMIKKLSKDARIIFMGTDKEKIIYNMPSTLSIPQALPSTRTDYLQSYGYKGQGVKIAILERGNPTASNSCFNISQIQDTTTPAREHITGSLGLIGNRYNSVTKLCNGRLIGYAPLSSVYLANKENFFGYVDYKNAYDWAKARKVNIVTMSWQFTDEQTNGDLHSRDKYFDYQSVHYPYPTIFTSAGNGGKRNEYASGKGYNILSVGNIENDLTPSYRCNDTISPSSSYKNPTSPHSDREIPEIAAPGQQYFLPGLGLTSYGNLFSGTSASTPVAASIASIIMQQNTQLKSHPEAIRAILQAGANYQGADGSNFAVNVDGKDGTGMLNTWYNYGIAQIRSNGTFSYQKAHDYGTMQYSDFNQEGTFNKKWKISVPNKKNSVRVALTWNSKTNDPWFGSITSELVTDLDLQILDPLGNLVAFSVSYDNNNEFVDFPATIAGNYTIQIRNYNLSKEDKITYAIAWTVQHDCL